MNEKTIFIPLNTVKSARRVAAIAGIKRRPLDRVELLLWNNRNFNSVNPAGGTGIPRLRLETLRAAKRVYTGVIVTMKKPID